MITAKIRMQIVYSVYDIVNGLLVFQTSLKLIVICFCKIIFKLPFFKVCFNVFKDVQL